jgi:hypothetical protein
MKFAIGPHQVNFINHTCGGFLIHELEISGGKTIPWVDSSTMSW